MQGAALRDSGSAADRSFAFVQHDPLTPQAALTFARAGGECGRPVFQMIAAVAAAIAPSMAFR